MTRKPAKLPPIYVACPHCKGEGLREITGVYRETLELLRRHTGITGAALAASARCQPTAMNNRLARLEELGLVESTILGRERLYKTKAGL